MREGRPICFDFENFRSGTDASARGRREIGKLASGRVMTALKIDRRAWLPKSSGLGPICQRFFELSRPSEIVIAVETVERVKGLRLHSGFSDADTASETQQVIWVALG